MAKNNETGHAVNASNFVEKINVISRNEADYKPTNAAILLTALLTRRDTVKGAVELVSVTKTAFKQAAAKRKDGYENLVALATRSVNILNASGATKIEIKEGKSLLAKLKSIRVNDIPDEEEVNAKAAANGETPKVPKTVSVSQQGFVNLLAHFNDIVLFLRTVTAYKPNEADLTPDALAAYAQSLDALNVERNKASAEWAKAIEARNNLMYAEPSGAYHLSNAIMAYVAGSNKKSSLFYKELLKYPVRSYK